MTPEQTAIVEKIANRIAYKYIFGPFEFEDVRQQIFLFAIEAMDKWDGSRPLENFLAVVLPNKMKNFKRNNYYRLGVGEKYTDINDAKKNLMEMVELFDSEENVDYVEKINGEDAVKRVLAKLTPSVRSDFLRLANGVTIPKIRKDKVYEQVREILKEF